MRLKDMATHKVKRQYQVQRIKKEQRFYEGCLKGNEKRGTEILFNKGTISWLIVIVTFFLQLIALASTFEGSKVYFGSIVLPFKLSAPLLFALAIQGIVFCMRHTIRRHFKPWLILILGMATACSNYFSYVGIYNHIHSPLNYLEERYTQLYGQLTDSYQLMRDEKITSMKGQSFEMFGMVLAQYNSLSKEVEDNRARQEKLDNIQVTSGQINPQTSSLKRPNSANYGTDLDRYYADMAKYNAAVGNMITDTTKQDAELRAQLYANEVKQLLGEQTKEAFVAESAATLVAKEQLESLIQSMYRLVLEEKSEEVARQEEEGHQALMDNGTEPTIQEQLQVVQAYVMDFITLGKGNTDRIATLLTQLYTEVSRYGTYEVKADFLAEMNQLILMRGKASTLMKSYEEVRQAVRQTLGLVPGVLLTEKDAMLLYSVMQSEVQKARFTLGSEAVEGQLENLYVLPIRQLIVPSEGRAMAWFALVFALLIDGLTLLFSLMEGKERSALFAKRNKDIIGKSDVLMEEMLLAHLMALEGSVSKKDAVATANANLRKFLTCFQIVPEEMAEGYAMWASLEDLGGYHSFVAVLCQFNLAKLIAGRDIPFAEEVTLEQQKKYVFLKTKFIIWMHAKLVALTKQEGYIERLDALDEKDLPMKYYI